MGEKGTGVKGKGSRIVGRAGDERKKAEERAKKERERYEEFINK